MSRRTLLLIAALVLAAVGTVLVFMYAQNAQNVATEGQTLKKVLVAKTAIEVGTTGAAAAASGSFTEQELPASAIVDGAIDDAAPLASLVTTVPIFPGQQIISQQWGAAALATGLTIPEGKIAVSIQLGDPERVAGFIAPGSIIAVFATGGPSVRLLLPRVEVIAVGPTTVVSRTTGQGSSANVEQIPTAILTVALSQIDAERIIFAQGKAAPSVYSGLYFALTDKNSKLTPNDAGVTDATLFS
ncbi:unannotated protein [freshwater metagenome]|uniref:Unannotated protein n=1 Tax=freshwater metagenome TaxID=449393 RepID=A0A6J7KBX8_9ZZZZ|nr:hypothetical protein [Actinomycetota bacterium]MSW37368.1 hypothetical protein [Actinomycetota bacterium]